MKTRIIVNPMANKGNCARRWPEIRSEIEKQLGQLKDDDVVMTRARGHATHLAKEAADAGCERLVSVGGDGTLSEVLNGIVVDDRPVSPDLVLAQIPGGTSNEVCRAFRQATIAEACRAIAEGGTREVDVFRADATDANGRGVTRYGFLLAIVGGAATISWRAQRVPLLKRLGPFAYIIMTAVTSLTYSPRQYRVRVDGEEEESRPVWGVLLCSFDGAGDGLMLAPGADPGDGKLDLITLGDIGKWESLTRVLPKLGDGSYIAHPKIARRHATEVTISSDRHVRADVDGESIGQLPMAVRLLPFRVRIASTAH